MRMALEEDYDYVFLVNQDAWIEANTVGTLVGLAEKYPDYGVLSPVHLDGKGEHLDGSFAKYVGGASAVSSKKSDIVEAAFVNAAFWFIPVSALKVFRRCFFIMAKMWTIFTECDSMVIGWDTLR